MKTKVLVVVDMQNDFVTGSLKNEEAAKIVQKVADKISQYKEKGYPIVATIDTHFQDYLDTQEGTLLPVKHCIVNTEGWKLVPEIEAVLKDYPRFKDVVKNTFGSIALPEAIRNFLKFGVPAEIELVGVCTDICVVSNALLLKAFYPEIQISVDASCCAGTTVENHQKALDVMKSCQVIVN